MPAAPQGAGGVREGLERLEAFFKDRASRAGVVARRLFGRPQRDDERLAEQLIQERRRRTRMTGSLDGSLVKTAWAAWEFLDLDSPSDHSAVVRTIGYVLSQQNKPGHFGEGCTPERHERGLCRHALSGFFSAGTADEDVAPLEFPSGITLADETEARFAASCFALRTVLRAGEDRRQAVIQHIESLLRLLERAEAWDGDQALTLTFFAVGALALAPITYRPRVEQFLDRLGGKQRPDGTWPATDLFHACDMLLTAGTGPAREALLRTVPVLLGLQLPSGAFDPAEHEERALIGARVLKLAAGA